MGPDRLFRRLISGALHNVSFADFCRVVEAFGFELDRIGGSHRLYLHRDVPGRLNLQSVRGQAKPYQIRQFLSLVEQYDLKLKE